MSVMLATTNPEAAARTQPRPLPHIAAVVRYRLREMRAGVAEVPALVLAVDSDNRLLKLMVIFDHQDMMTYERVPERIGSDQGWEYPEDSPERAIAELRAEVAAVADRLQSFMDEMSDVMWGDLTRGDKSVETRLMELERALLAAGGRPRGRVKSGE